MQAVILAAGRGTRMGTLVDTVPKPMLEVNGKTLLEHKFDVLPNDVDEIIIVIGYLGEVIQARYGDAYKARKITYVTQENIVGGTADALWQAKNILKGKFIVMMGDDIYAKEDIDAVRAHEWTLLVERVPSTAVGGRVEVDSTANVIAILEGSAGGEGVVSTNMFALDTRLFDFPMVPKAEGSSELGLPQTVLAASKTGHISFTIVEATKWIQISKPEDLARAEARLQG